VQTTDRPRHCERELRARTKAGMGGNDFRDVHVVAAVKREKLRDGLIILPDPITLRPRYARRSSSSDCKACLQFADGETDAAKASAEPSIEIEKAKMQPRRNGNHHLCRLRNAIVQGVNSRRCDAVGFLNADTGLHCVIPSWLAIGTVSNR
jgi:hypothetical protein